jgi:hypothetical protein
VSIVRGSRRLMGQELDSCRADLCSWDGRLQPPQGRGCDLARGNELVSSSEFGGAVVLPLFSAHRIEFRWVLLQAAGRVCVCVGKLRAHLIRELISISGLAFGMSSVGETKVHCIFAWPSKSASRWRVSLGRGLGNMRR